MRGALCVSLFGAKIPRIAKMMGARWCPTTREIELDFFNIAPRLWRGILRLFEPWDGGGGRSEFVYKRERINCIRRGGWNQITGTSFSSSDERLLRMTRKRRPMATAWRAEGTIAAFLLASVVEAAGLKVARSEQHGPL
jgi:hypothetical protein